MTTINTGQAPGKNYGAIYVRLVDRKERQRSVDQMSVPLRERLARDRRASPSPTSACSTRSAARSRSSCRMQGTDLRELERLTAQLMAAAARRSRAWWTWTAPQARQARRVAIDVKRDAAADLGLSVGAASPARCARWWPAQTVGNWRAADDENYDVKVRLAPESRDAAGRPASACR